MPRSPRDSTLVDRLCRLVATRSLSKHEGPIADLVAAELTAAGVDVARCGHSIYCQLGDAPRPRMLLNSHLDTVPPASGWSADPWTPRVEGGRVTGLGANDAKGCVAAMIETLLGVKRDLDRGRGLGGTLVLALTAEEETTGRGLIDTLPLIQPIDAAIVGEPTGLTPMIAQRGLLILRCLARGRTSHPANTPPDTAENAIQNALADIVRLHDFDWGEPHPLLGRCHAHVTWISGGLARNVIPDVCEFWLDVRTTPLESHAALTARLRELLRSEVHVHSDRLVPVQTAESEPVVQAVLRALPGTRPAGSATMSDMVTLRGVPCVKIGPGESARSHTPDEYVRAEELEAGAAAYGRMVREYFAS